MAVQDDVATDASDDRVLKAATMLVMSRLSQSHPAYVRCRTLLDDLNTSHPGHAYWHEGDEKEKAVTEVCERVGVDVDELDLSTITSPIRRSRRPRLRTVTTGE